ncbi:MAG: sulfatase-like hydrolase/transferase [Candidatus Hydrogenedentes bacterium]|nr:sulfatase-like hydrolase/transferase [Candidatus Hydrogenedentota bacterium]
MLALYFFALGASAGVVGVFARLVLFDQGYVPGFNNGVLVALGAACAYACIEVAYLTVVQVFWPSRGRGYLFAESLSHAAVLVLTPYLLHVSVAWPHPAFLKFEPAVYFAAFATVHLALKLVSFYAALRAEPGGRFATLVGFAAAILLGVGSYFCFITWLGQLETARPRAPEATSPFRVDGYYAQARPVPEGALFACALSPLDEQSLTFRWASPPDTVGTAPSRIHVSVSLSGAETMRISEFVAINKSGWTTFRIPPDRIPDGLASCEVTWHMKKEPSWRAATGFRPVIVSERRMLLAGPYAHATRTTNEGPNVVVIAVDGLGANRLSCLGYERDTTPSMDRLGFSGRIFVKAYTPAVDAEAGCMSLLTGLNPLKHGFLGGHNGPLPDEYATVAAVLAGHGYTTAAFTEGDANDDLEFGEGFERGFELFNTAWLEAPPPPEPPSDEAEEADEPAEPAAPPVAGSAATLQAARAWIDAHAGVKFFAFLRLQELAEIEPLERYPAKFIEEGQRGSAGDVYDMALAYVDEHVGAFIKHLRDGETRKNTCIIVTAPYGYDFTGRNPSIELNDECARVPILLYAPDLGKARHLDPVSVQDIAPTIAALTGADFPNAVDGLNLRVGPTRPAVVSMGGDPLTFVVRDKDWQMVWTSNRRAFRTEPAGREPVVKLYDARRASSAPRDLASSHPEVVREWTALVDGYGRP